MALAAPIRAVAVTPGGAATEASDARCLVAFAALASQDDPAIKQAAQTGSMIFVGKLLGRNPSIDLETAMRKAVTDIGTNMRAETQRCGGEMQAIGTAMSRAGEAMAKKP
ncbi:MAG: hypothetical protein ABIS51_21240 [Sphingomonas sp.]